MRGPEALMNNIPQKRVHNTNNGTFMVGMKPQSFYKTAKTPIINVIAANLHITNTKAPKFPVKQNGINCRAMSSDYKHV